MSTTRRGFLGGGLVVAAGACAIERARVVDFGGVDRKARREGVVHIGNSTHFIVLEGIGILTDPWVRDPADAVLSHTVPAAAMPTDIDVVLVTHEHEDHFDEAALSVILRDSHPAPAIVVPIWLEPRVRALGFRDVHALKPGEVAADVRGLRVEAVRALHDVDEVAYRCEAGRGESKRAIFFGGDTLPTFEIKRLAIRAPVDFAILPADGGSLLGKRWVMNPAEAIAMAEHFGAHANLRGAMLTHHEYGASFPWTLIVDVPAPRASDFPAWYRVPTPGQHLPFPWSPS